ncbi:DUF2971 domain-containing protein [Buttiauxella noackiae]|uniref:DUF2971 domain-containing protein n=1 Tax=Buttiauxella noackiae TaxID=82992 RepID=UPI00235526B7|nr:DUF2971 domain-containing protein [Buttiauxella noackiae]MCA1923238.1 DUF2971 domain-containing protein [Buttiauxella noackiae]
MPNPSTLIFPFFKYVGIESAMKIILNSSLKFNTPDQFNDPFDINPVYPKEGFYELLKSKTITDAHGNPIEYDPEAIYAAMHTQNSREQSCRHIAVTCFSKSAQIGPMWAHYADNHKGCVLEFEFTEDDQSQIDKHVLEYKYSVNPDLLDPQPVEYPIDNERPVAYGNNGQVTGFGRKVLFTKPYQWHYEQEVRCIRRDPAGFYPFPRHQLKRVIFGLKTPEDEKRAIRALIEVVTKEHGAWIDVAQIEMEHGTYNLLIK